MTRRLPIRHTTDAQGRVERAQKKIKELVAKNVQINPSAASDFTLQQIKSKGKYAMYAADFRRDTVAGGRMYDRHPQHSRATAELIRRKRAKED